jgi:hypothetical protein
MYRERVLYMNLGTTRLRGRPRNRWQGEVREDGRIIGGEVWQEKVHNREEWKKLLRTARNHCILHMPMEWHGTGEVHASKSISILYDTYVVIHFCYMLSVVGSGWRRWVREVLNVLNKQPYAVDK